MSLVVAVLSAKTGNGSQVIESFREVSPLVHEEKGCELYSAHLEQDGDVVVMVERWTTRADLDAHASGSPLARLNELNADLLSKPYDVWFLNNMPLGDAQGHHLYRVRAVTITQVICAPIFTAHKHPRRTDVVVGSSGEPRQCKSAMESSHD